VNACERDKLIDAWLDETIDAADAAALEAWIAEDVEHAAYFFKATLVHHGLYQQAGDPAMPQLDLPRDVRVQGSGFRVQKSPSPMARLRAVGVYVAAAAVIALALTAWIVYWSEPQPVVSDAVIAPQPLASVATTDEVVWASDPLVPGQDIAPQTIRMVSGRVEFVLKSGALMRLSGPSVLTIDDAKRVSLVRGQAMFPCPEPAHGFTVALPGGYQVMDLGTQFVIRVEADGSSKLAVLDGRVEVRDRADRTITLAAGQRCSLSETATLPTPRELKGWNYHETIEADHPRAYWPLDDADASGPWRDRVTGRTASPVGDVNGDAPGPFFATRAAAFDGTSAIALGPRRDLQFDGPFTVEAWVRIDPDMIHHGRIISFNYPRAGWGLGLFPPGDKGPHGAVRFTLLTVKDYDIALPRWPAGQWAHLAGTFDGVSEVRVFIDGQPVGAMTAPARMRHDDQAVLSIAQQAEGAERFVGRIAHVAVYDRVLNVDRIQTHFRAGEP